MKNLQVLEVFQKTIEFSGFHRVKIIIAGFSGYRDFSTELDITNVGKTLIIRNRKSPRFHRKYTMQRALKHSDLDVSPFA
jgi:hypothetical protein